MTERTGISARLNSVPKKERSGIAPPGNSFLPAVTGFSSAVIQRKASCACGGGCPGCQSKLPVQTKLSISEPGDIYEQEADRVADQVMRMPEHPVQHHSSPSHNAGGGEMVQCKPLVSTITPLIQRQSLEQVEDEETTEDKLDVQRFAGGDGDGGDVPGNFLSSLGPGSPLDPQTQSFFEPRFGADFSNVRIHTDAQAAQSAGAVNAKAYTVGHNIVFGAGHYGTDTWHGKQLIAHELTHVVQQSGDGSSQIVTTRSNSPHLARSVDDWLTGSVNISAWTYTQLVSEVDELTQYLNRQTSSSPEAIQVEEALMQLRAEVNRREATAVRPRARSRGRTRGRTASTPTANTEPLPARYPRILTEMTSVAYADPAEMRAEYDLIMQWLARSEVTDTERRILIVERDNLAPQFRSDRERVVAERHAGRIRAALTPTETGSANELVELTRTILGIASEPGNPSIAYIYHGGERLVISADQAQTLHDTMRQQLSNASRRIESRLDYAWGRYTAQVEINDDHPIIISSIAGFFGGVEDPGDGLYISYRTCMTRVHRMQRLIEAGSMLEAAQLLPRAERIAAEVSDMSRQFYEGYIEGAGIAVRRLEFTRDASFAIAGSIAAVVAAPVVAGAVGVGGLGLTGASATIATIGGTGVVVGTGMAGVRGTSAAGGVLLAGGSLSEAGSAFTSEAWRGFREGFLSGAGGAAARSVGLAINVAGGSLARQVATRVGAEMLINGTTTMVDVLARGGTIEEAARAAVISAAQAAPGALLGGSNNPVVRNLLAPFTAGGTSYLAARANGASPEDALAQAGVALASNIAMSRAIHTPDADAALVERGRAIGAGTRETVVSTARRAAPHAAAVMIGVADALPPVRSGYGGTSVVMDTDSMPRIGATGRAAPSVDTASTGAAHADADVTPPGPVAAVTDAAPSSPHLETDTPTPVATATPHIDADVVGAATHPDVASTTTATTAPATAAVAASPVAASTTSTVPAIHDSEALGASLTAEFGLDTPGTHVPSGTRAARIADAHADAVAAGWVDANGDPVAGGSVHAVVGEHGDASDRRSATGQTGATRESAHIGATSILRTLAGYSRRLAMTVLLPRATHQAFDHHWMRWIFNRRNAIRASGSTNFTATLGDLLAAQRQALQQTPNLSPQTRSTLEGMLEREFRNYASTLPGGMNTPVPLPSIWGS
jgi:hypothetical protein